MDPHKIVISECYLKIRGYASRPRQDFLLCRLGMSSDAALLYFILRDVMTDWDERHMKYSHYKLDYAHIHYLLGWSYSKAYRNHRYLVSIGAVELIDSQRMIYKLTGYELLKTVKSKGDENKKANDDYGYTYQLLSMFHEVAKTKDLVADMQEKLTEMQMDISFLKNRDGLQAGATIPANSKYSTSLVASNVDIGVYHHTQPFTQGTHTHSQTTKELSAEDKEWIDRQMSKLQK